MYRDLTVNQTWTTVTPPASEPVTLNEARTWCRIDADNTSEDAALTRLIRAAREYCETWTRRQFMRATLLTCLDRFPWHVPWQRPSPPWVLDTLRYAIYIPRPPLVAVTGLVYVDPAGTQATLDPAKYVVDPYSEPGKVTPKYGMWWPGSLIEINAVQITYTAGWATAADVPASLGQAILMLTSHWYNNREPVGQVTGEVALSVESLLLTHRVEEFY